MYLYKNIICFVIDEDEVTGAYLNWKEKQNIWQTDRH